MQEEFDYGDAARIRYRCDLVREVVREIDAVVGRKELMFRADMSKSHVSEAIDGGKSMPSKLEQAALQAAPEELRQKLADAMVGGYFKAERRLPMTPEQRERALLAAMRKKLGDVADDIEREAYGG